MSRDFVSHFDRLVPGCMACVPARPSGVQYGNLIEATRAQIERNYRRPLFDRLFRSLIFALFPHPRRLRLLLPLLWLYQRSGLRWLLRKKRLVGLGRRAPASAGIAAAGNSLETSSSGLCRNTLPDR